MIVGGVDAPGAKLEPCPGLVVENLAQRGTAIAADLFIRNHL